MEIRAFDFKKYDTILFNDIFQIKNGSEPVEFDGQEFKSLLALLFSFYYNYPTYSDRNLKEVEYLFSEKDMLLNTTRDFGRVIIENLEGYNKEYFEMLQTKKYEINDLLNNFELRDFIQTALIDYMVIRDWEYGRFFMQHFSKLVVDTRMFIVYSDNIKSILINDDDYLKKIEDMLNKNQKYLSDNEKTLLILIFKDNLFKSRMSMRDYFIASQIIKENLFGLSMRVHKFKIILNDCLQQKWNNSKGKGGPRL